MAKDIFREGDNLIKRCLHACSWVAAGSISTQIIRMVRWLVLTYILAPEDLGIVILVWAVLGLLQELSDTGIKHALIQNRKGLEQEYLDSAWLINVIRNISLIIILYLIAPIVAENIYGKAELKVLLRLSCLILAFDGLSSVGLVALRKSLLFKSVTIVNVVANAIGTIAAIGFAWRLGDAKGVVLGEVCGSGSMCIMAYLVHPFRPRIKWDRCAIRELLSYGVMAYLVTLVDAIGMRVDILLLGKVAGEAEVAHYGLGMAAILAPCQVFSLLTVSVGFPALSIIQHDKAAVRKGTAQIIKAAQMLAVPLFSMVALLASDMVRILPEKYGDIAEVLRCLCIYGICMVFLRQVTPALYAINRVFWCVIRGVMHLVIIGVLVIPMYRRWGLLGACWSANIALIITDIFVWCVLCRELCWPWSKWFSEMKVLWQSILGGLTGFGIAYIIVLIAGYNWTSMVWVRIGICLAGLFGYGVLAAIYYRASSQSTRGTRKYTLTRKEDKR